MTAAEVGQYVLLLCAARLGGKDATLPEDPRTLARLARATTGRVAPVVMRKFISTSEGRLLNLRLSAEWKAACARANVRSEKAQKAATKRWNVHAPSMVQALPAACSDRAPEMPSSSSPTPYPDQDDENHHHPQSDDDYRASLLEAKTAYLARCEGNVAPIDYALTEIINRTPGPVSSPFKFFEKSLEKFFDPSNQRDGEMLQQWLSRQSIRDSATLASEETLEGRRANR